MPGLPETGKSVVNVLLLNTRAMRVTAIGLCHSSYALMGSFVCLVSAREAKLLRA